MQLFWWEKTSPNLTHTNSIDFKDLARLLEDREQKIISLVCSNISIYVIFNYDHTQTYRFAIPWSFLFELPSSFIRQSKKYPKKFFIDLRSMEWDILSKLKTIVSRENAQLIYKRILESHNSSMDIFDIHSNINFYSNTVYNLSYSPVSDHNRKQYTSEIIAPSLSYLIDEDTFNKLSEIGKQYIDCEELE